MAEFAGPSDKLLQEAINLAYDIKTCFEWLHREIAIIQLMTTVDRQKAANHKNLLVGTTTKDQHRLPVAKRTSKEE